MANHTFKYSQAEKALWVSRWQASGQSRLAFSKEQGLNYNNFKQWALVHKKSQQVVTPVSQQQPAAPSPATPAFVAIQMDHSAASLPSMPVMEISFANGSHLSIYQQLSAAYLRELLQ